MAEVIVLIWGKRETEYLCNHDWTGQISLICHDKLDFARTSIEPLQRLALRSGRTMSAVPAKAELALRP